VKRQQKTLLGVVILIAAAIAYFLKDLIHEVLLMPISYLWYLINLMYLSVAQIVLWFVLVVIFALVGFGSLYGKLGSPEGSEEDLLPQYGPVGVAARQITRSREGIYYKWLIANRLGKLARSVVMQRGGRDRVVTDELFGPEWQPPVDVQAYLESGLNLTFADFPRRRLLRRRPDTPLDINVEKVLTYIDSQVEQTHD